MKKLFVFLFMALSMSAISQTKTIVNQGSTNQLWHHYGGIVGDSVVSPIVGSGAPTINMLHYLSIKRISNLYNDTTNKILYYYNPIDNTWTALGGSVFVPTWENTLDVTLGSVLDRNHTILGSGFSYTHNGLSTLNFVGNTNTDSLIVADAVGTTWGTQPRFTWNKRYVRIDTLNYRFPTAHSNTLTSNGGTDGSLGDVRVLADTSGNGTLVWKEIPYMVNSSFARTYFGYGAGGQRTVFSGSSVSAFGFNAGANLANGANNVTLVGTNTAINALAIVSLDGFGVNTLFNVTTGTNNTAFGTYALNGITTQSNNAAFGAGALSTDITNATRNQTGVVASGSTSVGVNSGSFLTANYSSTTTANNSIFLGHNNGFVALGNSLDSTTIIGNFMKTSLSNVFVLGGATQHVIIPNNSLTVATDNGTKLQTPSFSAGLVQKSATYLATAYDYTIECTSGTFTVTLPTSVGISGRFYFVTNTGSGTITVATTSSQTFVNQSGTPTTMTIAQFGGVLFQSNNANWIVVSKF